MSLSKMIVYLTIRQTLYHDRNFQSVDNCDCAEKATELTSKLKKQYCDLFSE